MRNDKKLTIFLNNLGAGGAQKVILNLGEEFEKAGINVDYVVAKRGGEFVSRVTSGPSSLIELQADSYATALRRFRNYLLRRKPDVILSTIPEYNLLAVAAVSTLDIDCKLVVRESIEIEAYINSSNGFIRNCLERLAPVSYSLADRVVACSQAVKDGLLSYNSNLEDKIIFIPNPVRLQKINQSAKKEVQIPGADQKPVVISVGSLVSRKDFTTLLKAFSIFRETVDAKLLILGEGEERENLKQLARTKEMESDVYLPGFVENPYPYMKKADLFVHSSKFEGMPNVLLETLAVGTPIVATNCPGGSSQILQDGKYGELVPVGNVDQMAAAMKREFTSPTEKQKLINRAADFSIDKIFKKYWEVMRF